MKPFPTRTAMLRVAKDSGSVPVEEVARRPEAMDRNSCEFRYRHGAFVVEEVARLPGANGIDAHD